jgi:oxalate decarboxylase
MHTLTSAHVASLTNSEIVEESDLGSIRRLTADNFGILQGLSIKRLLVNPGAMRTPHWHANANELTYCVSGSALVSVLDTGNKFASFVVRAGDMFHIDSGSLHHIENIGPDTAEFIISFRNERPEDFGLGASFAAMTDAVLGNTYDLPASDFAAIRHRIVDRALAAREGEPDVPATAYFDDPHKFSIESMTPPVSSDVNRGAARMTVMNPGGQLDTWYLQEGDVYFVPRAYPHHIEVFDAPDMHFCIFFDQPTPGDIGYRTSISAYSREVLAATFGTHIDDLPEFPFTKQDPLIVNRINPLDAHALGEW